ncbi:hypothetical protein PILCRDRAFT_58687 [Piloderma croceum F 1598]|uniref:TRUD domain-containing protein n=1 Tax=Piloderma croceum (strain F 1598) TaxID=765440 RepID=A0A0C3GGY8_PILCF|nr:hypothetical protein PILCRDRAFT_58687 [Piloderma croceum F 1598]
MHRIVEADVGISEYISHDVSKISGIIKQRFTDFLVYEVDLDYNVIHIKSLDMPKKEKTTTVPSITVETPREKGKSKEKKLEPDEPWPDRFTVALAPFLPEDAVAQVKAMFLEGPEPPRVSDSGWGGRPVKPAESDIAEASSPISDKATRTALHQTVRELFGGKLDSETHATASEADGGSQIAIKWARRGGGRGGARGDRAPRGTYPPYIHFTLQKTNRDTQDALAYLSRLLHVNIKDLSVAGTKDKRGVTVQRVALRRHNKTVEDVWKLANGQVGRKSKDEVLTRRGERGVRIADLNYRKSFLDLGMLKGNAFVITLRYVFRNILLNVEVDSVDTLDRAMNSMKHKGFINYYGMQRFGTATIPTHSVGLALLKSDWHHAISLIMRKRPGEHPEVVAARDAWLIDGDLDRAIELMPRRVVAERCILESFKKQKGDTRNAMGALSTIPRNLRLMYVHAYQSYVWNAIVSERIRMHGSDKPVVGDLVFDTELGDKKVEGDDHEMAIEATVDEEPDKATDTDEPGMFSTSGKPRRTKPWQAPRVKTLTEEDLDKCSIFDVIMPLPGTDVAYPGGQLGELYRKYLELDGLDPDCFIRKQKEYTLGGSYRKILQLPKDFSWTILRYTDPDVALAQADEDKLLGFDPPVIVEDGKFMALQIHLTLGTAAYATMALREVTKTETSSHFQSNLTLSSEDQKFKGVPASDEQEEN